MGQPVPHGRCRWIARSLLTASFIASQPGATCAAIETLRRQRHTGKHIAAERVRQHRQPRSSPLGLSRIRIWSRPSQCAATARTRRDDPYRYQKARPFQPNRSPHHRQEGSLQSHGGFGCEFIHVCIDDIPGWPSPRSGPVRRPTTLLPSSRRPSLFTKPSAHRHPLMTDNGVAIWLCLSRCLQRARPQAYPHQALHAQNQRQGRALHPDRTQRWAYAQAYPNSDLALKNFLWLTNTIGIGLTAA